jgi:hypothetical protein
MSHKLSNVDNSVLNNLAKSMGVVTSNEIFATYDIIKDLEVARNCLYSKQQKPVNESTSTKIVEFILENDNSFDFEITEDNSDVEGMMVQQSNKKKAVGKKKVKFSIGGRKHDQEVLGSQDSRDVCIPVNLNKRKRQRKKW